MDQIVSILTELARYHATTYHYMETYPAGNHNSILGHDMACRNHLNLLGAGVGVSDDLDKNDDLMTPNLVIMAWRLGVIKP